MLRVAIVGLGKMGLSHLSIFRAHPDVELVGVCDSSSYVLDVLHKYTGIATFSDLDDMVERAKPDAVVIATPSHLHASMVRRALDAGLHVFCEKPFCLDPDDSATLENLAVERGLITQVGYHNRFVASFGEAKRLIDAGAVGRVTHILAEAYGPVVLAPSGSSWRSKKAAGGGCLYDYAAHPLDLVTWLAGPVVTARGSLLTSVFSKETDDEVCSTLELASGASAQLSVSWSDESQRKMTTKLTIWGTGGRIYVDRQEIQTYIRSGQVPPDGYRVGWNTRYTTDLTAPVWFYLRGEEYSAQADAFVQRAIARSSDGRNTFADALVTDRALALIVADAAGEVGHLRGLPPVAPRTTPKTLRARLVARAGQLRPRRVLAGGGR